jgi:hypothetical protein
MSETRLVIVDSETIHEGTIHASIADRCVAALSAEPENFAELQAALIRYFNDPEALAGLRRSTDVRTERCDAGIVIIDLAARVIACESTYSQPVAEGTVNYHDGRAATDIPIRYRIPDLWQIVESIELYLEAAAAGRIRRAATPPLDARRVLYGRPLLEFIVAQAMTRFFPQSDQEDEWPEIIDRQAREIHALWLLTPRSDLKGQAPRDVLLARLDFVECDLDSRELQWSILLEAPPCLTRDSHAYRFAGFGRHENVMYYDLVRYLICCAIDFRQSHGAAEIPAGDDLEPQTARLEQIKQEWLETPGPDSGGRAPVNIIESERCRLPLALQPSELLIDDDCPLCVMSAQEAAAGISIGFQHFDGSHMDEDFAFSFYQTRKEWEEENRRREAFDRDFNRRWKEREARIAAGENPAIVDAALGFDYTNEFGESEDLGGPQLVG